MKALRSRQLTSIAAAIVLFWLLLAAVIAGEEISGVQPVALDQPRIYLKLRTSPQDRPLSLTANGQSVSAVEAFLDTGSSGVVLAAQTAKALKVEATKTAQGQPITFQDVGVGGAEQFGVSSPLYLTFAAYSSNTDGEDEQGYGLITGPLRTAIRPAEGLLERLTGGLDIAGMAAIKGKVMVIDARPLRQFDKLRTSLLPPGDKTVPKTSRHVPLTRVSFDHLTRLGPAGAAGPGLAASPMIGPDPFKPGDAAAAIQASHNGKSVKMTMLLDTGSACSMISRRCAEALGVHYSEDESRLLGVAENQQFSLTIGGIGGQKSARGFYLDLLTVPTREAEPLIYAKAPVLVADITATDSATGKSFTLDGVFGMNFLVATAEVTGGLLPDIGKLTDGPFTHIVIDEPNGILGLKDR